MVFLLWNFVFNHYLLFILKNIFNFDIKSDIEMKVKSGSAGTDFQQNRLGWLSQFGKMSRFDCFSLLGRLG